MLEPLPQHYQIKNITREKVNIKEYAKNNLNQAIFIFRLGKRRSCGQFGSWLKVREYELVSDRAYHSKMNRRNPFRQRLVALILPTKTST